MRLSKWVAEAIAPIISYAIKEVGRWGVFLSSIFGFSGGENFELKLFAYHHMLKLKLILLLILKTNGNLLMENGNYMKIEN